MLAGHVVNMPGLPIAACTLPGKSNIAVARPADPTSSHHVFSETWLSSCRGICHKGKDCDYLHQLPTEYHEQLLTSDHTVDIFGRDKLAGANMGTKGVGTYDRESKTLYVNYGGAGHLGAPVIRQLLQVIGTYLRLCHSLALEVSQWLLKAPKSRSTCFCKRQIYATGCRTTLTSGDQLSEYTMLRARPSPLYSITGEHPQNLPRRLCRLVLL